MDQIDSMIEILNTILSNHDKIQQELIGFKSELELWKERLSDALSTADNKTLPKAFLEVLQSLFYTFYYDSFLFQPLFDLIHSMFIKLAEASLLHIPPESEWDGVVPTFSSLAGVHNSLPLGTRGGYYACPKKFNVRGMNYLRDGVKVSNCTHVSFDFLQRLIQAFGDV